MAAKLTRIKDRAAADAMAPEIKKLDDDIRRIIFCLKMVDYYDSKSLREVLK